MIKIKPVACEGRPCIVEVFLKGSWLIAGWTDETMKTPVVCDCEHEAFDMQITIMNRAATLVAVGQLKPDEFPGPQDFRLKYVDEVPESYDAEVKDLSHAEAIIRRLQGEIKG